MSPLRRQVVMGVVLVSLLLLAAVWCIGVYRDARRGLAAAREDSRAVVAIAAQIEALRRRPTLQGSDGLGGGQLATILERAAESVGFNANEKVRSIGSEVEQGLPNSPYRQRTTEVRLQGLTLEELGRFLYEVSSQNPGLRVASLQLSSAGGDEGEGAGARWNVDPLVLSYLVYAPEQDGRRADGRP